jgi:diguanylate cyclase (GGDEF)-like protein
VWSKFGSGRTPAEQGRNFITPAAPSPPERDKSSAIVPSRLAHDLHAISSFERPFMQPRLARHPLVLAGIFGIYFALGQLGIGVGGFAGDRMAVWPASGFAIAALVIVGRRAWPAILAGAFFSLLIPTHQFILSAVVAAGYTVEALLGALLIDRLARGEKAFQSAATIFRFVAVAAVVAACGATPGALSTVFLGPAQWIDFAYLWMSWWLAGFAGILVIGPFSMLWVGTPVDRPRVIELAEALAILAVLTGLCLVVFAGRFPSDVQNYPLEFLCVPVLLWAAFRQGRRTVVTATTILSGLAVWGTVHGFGPFVRDSQYEALVLVHAYACVMATMGAVLAAVVSEHKHAERQLREMATTDPLTGLANYRRLLEVLKIEIARSNRTGRPFAVLFVDMNGLKKLNDRYGHLAGSRALCRIVDNLRLACRQIDTPARFGGDEFAVVLPETGEAGGQVVLRRISERLASEPAKPTVSISGGVAVFPRDGDSPTLLLRAADKLLYRAKAESAASRKRVAEEPDERKTGTLF